MDLARRLGMSKDETDAFACFLKKSGRKAAPWVRTIILAAIAQEEHLASLRPELTLSLTEEYFPKNQNTTGHEGRA